MKIDFSYWKNFDSCPVWWRNYVIATCKGLSGLSHDWEMRDKVLCDGLAAYDAVIVPDQSYDQEIDYIEFRTNEDYLAFVLRWM